MVIAAASTVEPSVQRRIDFVFLFIRSPRPFFFRRNKEAPDFRLPPGRDADNLKCLAQAESRKICDAFRGKAASSPAGFVLPAGRSLRARNDGG